MQFRSEMHLSVTLLVCILVACITKAQGQASNCPFHLCTPQNLRCPNGRLLLDGEGCTLCQCEEAYPTNRDSNCTLHGCTVQLLRCNGQLQVSGLGCTLCECDDQGIKPTQAKGVRMTIPRILTTTATTPISTAMASNLCPATQCEELPASCPRLKRSPVTGCPICLCDDGNTDLCPNPMEFLSGEGMRRSSNLDSRNFPKYKIILGKLKKGFVPDHTYKIMLKTMDNNNPFKEFLLEVGSTPHTVARSNKKKKMVKRTRPRPSADGVDEGRGRECGSGFWNPAKNPRKAQSRLFPDCNTAAMQINKNINKTVAALLWTAPKCGCVYIRASLVDYSGNTVYLYDDSPASTATGYDPTAPSGRMTQPLYRTVCAKAVFKRKKSKSKTKQNRVKVRDPIAINCCHAAKKLRRSDNCERRATVYAETFTTRFNVLKRTCKNAYKDCCRLFTSRVIGLLENYRNTTVNAGRHQHRRTGGDLSTTYRLPNQGSQANQNERIPRRKKKRRGGKRRKALSKRRTAN